ncbi:MAG: hypothetical protein KIT84_20990 [Labilithrix sp.]|nr:hypothetical protein [Labilithrix sp.]MCW5813519.1 hypothetical protein [Labilithrix sp.]
MKSSARALGLMLVMGLACSRSPLGLEVNVPANVAIKWIEIGAFKDGSCPTLQPMLEGGLPEGYTARLAYQKNDPAAPGFGRVPNAKYAFAGVARDESCAVVAAGCSEVDVGDADNIAIMLGPVGTPKAACPKGSVCEAARCLPANDSADPSVGAGCSLELLGAGPLANSSGQDGTVVSPPAIAASPGGFLLVYREIDPGIGTARLVLQPLDPSGGALKAERPNLPGRCAASADVERDGIGIALNESGAGTVVLSKASCTADPPNPSLQMLALAVDDKGKMTLPQFIDSPSPNGTDVRLGPARPSTARASNNVIVFTEGGAGKIATVKREEGIVQPRGTFGGNNITDAWVSATDKVLALLSVGPGDPGSPPPGDAGADAGEGPIGSQSDTTVRLLMLKGDTDVQTVATSTTRPVTFPGTFGSLATTGERVLVVTDGAGPGRSVTYRAFDLGKEEEADTNGYSIEGAAKVTAADVAIVGNRAYVAALQQGQVALHVFDNATTALTPLRNVLFSRQTRISGINNVRDGSVAVAASPTRVAVVWTTAKELGSNDPAGGYAVFACTQ